MQRYAVPVLIGASAYLGGLTAALISSHGLPSIYAQTAGVTRSVDDSALARLGDRFEGVAKKIGPAVVALEAVKPSTKGGKSRSVDDSGSGVIVRLPGRREVFVLTNNHVVGQAPANQIPVNLADSRILKPTRVWVDPESDIAVLGLAEEDLPAADLGDSDQMRV